MTLNIGHDETHVPGRGHHHLIEVAAHLCFPGGRQVACGQSYRPYLGGDWPQQNLLRYLCDAPRLRQFLGSALPDGSGDHAESSYSGSCA